MRLVLRGYSQDVDFLNQRGPTDNYLVFENEENGQLLRLPVPWETIVELATMAGVGPEEEPGEQEESQEDEPEDEPEEPEEEPEPAPPPVRRAKTMPQPPAPHVFASTRQKITAPTSEDDVPSV